MRLEALAERAMSELGLELDPLVEEYGPHMLVPELIEDADNASDPGSTTDRDAAQASAGGSDHLGRPYVRSEQEKRLAKASRDLARLGKVNPLALEEHAALEQRHQFLAEQLADLKRSRDDLLSIVEEIDSRVQEVFTQAYEDTARQFASVFDRLFPGGEGRLVLTDPDDMLTTGIEMRRAPPARRSNDSPCSQEGSARWPPWHSWWRSSRRGPRPSTSWTRSRRPWTTRTWGGCWRFLPSCGAPASSSSSPIRNGPWRWLTLSTASRCVTGSPRPSRRGWPSPTAVRL